ncbi:LysR substrate-binding domain-containing protein [Variovorax sp. LjRoot178]|uniref:LysR substrate-binding domain-containing protein n=1 Tax=Variovorax sp. LjRoot178 TaxID=3342277 RepID=UPI003ECE50EC
MLLREIEVFRSVMSVGSASKAAALMGVTQPAVSQSLRRLEEAAGFALFRRLRGRLHATPEAQALLLEVERVFVGLDSIEHRMRSLKRFGVNTLRVAVYPAFGLTFVPRVLSRLVAERRDSEARPQISLQVLSSREVHEAVLGRQVDFGLMADEMPTTGLEHSEFARFPGVVVMHAKHRLVNVKTIQPRQLAEEPFLALNPEDASRRRLERALADCDVGLSVVVETPYAASVCEMAMRGLGIGVVNPITALEYAQRGLVIRPLSLDVSFAGLLVLPPGQPLSSVALRVLQLMRIQLAEDQKALSVFLKPDSKR